MQVELLFPDAARDQIRTVWCTLEDACRPRYWLSWAWVETWLDSLPVALRPNLVVVKRGGRPVAAFFLGVVPVVRHRVLPSRSGYMNQTGSPAHDLLHIEYNAWVHEPGIELDVREVLQALPVDWDELVMSALDSRSIPGRTIRGAHGPYRVRVTSTEPSPLVDLGAVRGADGGYLSLLGGSTRSSIRRSRKAYAEQGELVLDAATTLPVARAFLAELAELSRRRFEGSGEGSSFTSAYFCAFHDQLVARRFEHGEIQLLRLRAGDATIGLLYNFVSNGVVHFYQSGFRYETDNRYKPGLLLHAEAIELNARAGHDVYDFLGGTARYKKELSTSARELVSVRVQKPLARFIIEGQLRELRAWVRELQRVRRGDGA